MGRCRQRGGAVARPSAWGIAASPPLLRGRARALRPREGVASRLVCTGCRRLGARCREAHVDGDALGAAEVDAGGTHEALVGAGYFVGPGLGLATLAAGAGTPVFIGLVLGALAVGFVFAAARAGRAKSHATA